MKKRLLSVRGQSVRAEYSLSAASATLHSMQLYAITEGLLDRDHCAGAPRQKLLNLVQEWTAGGVQFIQLREKKLNSAQLTPLATEVAACIDAKRSKLLINLASPELASIALAAGADGVHLAGKLVPGAADAVRCAFGAAGRQAILSVPCHSLEEIDLAREEGADLILFSPVFEKASTRPQGLKALREACSLAQHVPVFALGGITVENAADCHAAGAAGMAGIRLFAEPNWRRLTAV